jgi:hypothetical protein
MVEKLNFVQPASVSHSGLWLGFLVMLRKNSTNSLVMFPIASIGLQGHTT